MIKFTAPRGKAQSVSPIYVPSATGKRILNRVPSFEPKQYELIANPQANLIATRNMSGNCYRRKRSAFSLPWFALARYVKQRSLITVWIPEYALCGHFSHSRLPFLSITIDESVFATQSAIKPTCNSCIDRCCRCSALLGKAPVNISWNVRPLSRCTL